MFWTAVDHCVFFPFVMCLINKTWFELSRVKLCRNDLKGNKNYFELVGGSCYRGQNRYNKCMKEIQGKEVLVRVNVDCCKERFSMNALFASNFIYSFQIYSL